MDALEKDHNYDVIVVFQIYSYIYHKRLSFYYTQLYTYSTYLRVKLVN